MLANDSNLSGESLKLVVSRFQYILDRSLGQTVEQFPIARAMYRRSFVR